MIFPAGPRRGPAPAAARRAAGCALLALFFAGACGNGDGPTPPPMPDARVSGPVSEGGAGAGIAPAGSATGPTDPLATWTVPAADSALLGRTPGDPGGARGEPAADDASGAQGAGFGRIPSSSPVPPPAAGGNPDEPPPPDVAILQMMVRADGGRMLADVERLAGFGTRHVLSIAVPPERDHGIAGARDWLLEELEEIGEQAAGQMLLEREEFELRHAGRRTRQENVVATLPGIGRQKRLIYAVAHYDSRAADIEDGDAPAPGADDNASGTAVLLALARILSTRQWDATVRLVAFAAEEVDLAGSRHHAEAAAEIGMPISLVLNNDIVGGLRPAGADGDDRDDGRPAVQQSGLHAYSDDGPDTGSRQAARWARVVAERYGAPPIEVLGLSDRDGRRGDHLAFAEAGFPAVRLTTGVASRDTWHTERDTPEGVDADFLAATARANIALIANAALGPVPAGTSPRLTPGASGTLEVSWDSSEGDVAGYLVGLRRTDEQAYTAVHWVSASAASGPTTSLGVPEGATQLAVAVAPVDNLGRIGLFGPEGVAELP